MKTLEFIKQCKTFFLLTSTDNCPMGRPFGAIIQQNNDLYISTHDSKKVYAQLVNNSNVQIVALKNGTRNWIRISGNASECIDNEVKQKMLDECPILKNHFKAPDEPHFTVFKIVVSDTELFE